MGTGMGRGTNGEGSMIGGMMVGADVGTSGKLIAVDPPPEGLGVGMNMGDGDLLFVILLHSLRSF